MTAVLDRTADLDAAEEAAAAGAVDDLLVARLTQCLRAYLTVRAAAGPDGPATLLAARALDRACEDALAFEQDGLAPAARPRRRRERG
jgi:hypothetical protein